MTRRQAEDWIRSQRDRLALAVTDAHLAARPDLACRYGATGRKRCIEDAGHHLDQLAVAVGGGVEGLFVDYLGWAKVLLSGHGIGVDDLVDHLAHLERVLRDQAPEGLADLICRPLSDGIGELPDLPDDAPSELPRDGAHPPLAARYLNAVLGKRRRQALEAIEQAVLEGASVESLYLEVFAPVQREIGRLWQLNQITVADEHFATAVTQVAMSSLYPQIFASPRIGRSMVASCAEGDRHEIGIRMVADFFEMAGWDTIYLGADVPRRAVVELLATEQPDLLLMSTTMARHLPALTSVIETIRGDERIGQIPILVGGPPFVSAPELTTAIGADAFARDAEEALAVADRLVADRIVADGAAAGHVDLDFDDARRDDALILASRTVGSPTFDEMGALNNELVSLHRQLARQHAQLQRLSRDKDRLLGHVAHDLRNPLQSIVGYSRLLREGSGGPVTDKQRRFLDAIQRASAHMVSLVESLVDVSAMEAGVELQLSTFDFADQLIHDVEIHRVIAERKGIMIETAGATSLELRADSSKTSQVVHNLLSNAIKFSESGGRITVALVASDDHAKLTVSDEGVGISDEDLPHVFDPLVRGRGGTAGEKSTGLGLAIVNRLVEAHDGRIEVQSHVGAGTTFEVWLPLGGPVATRD